MITESETSGKAAQADTVVTPERAQSEFDRLLQRAFTPRDILDDSNFDKIWRMSEALSNSALSVPKELKGNLGDCMAIVTQAMIWGLNPFAVAQKAHVINGKIGYEAQLVNAVVMQSGAIKGSFHYEYRGEGNALECRVGAVLRGESAVCWGEWLSIAMITTKNSPLWKVNPKQQLGYLQVKNWARAFVPGALLGIYTTDELADGGFATDAASQHGNAGSPPPPPPGLPAYAAEAFATNLPAWTKLVADGKKTASALLAMLQTKATFTEPQKARILSLKPAAQDATPAPAPAPAQAAEPAPPPAGDEWADDYAAAEGSK